MAELLPWLGATGITLIISTGRIFAPLRAALRAARGLAWLGQLLSCSMCTGFWVGFANGLALGYEEPAPLIWSAGTVSLLSLAADAAIERLSHGLDLDDDPPPAP